MCSSVNKSTSFLGTEGIDESFCEVCPLDSKGKLIIWPLQTPVWSGAAGHYLEDHIGQNDRSTLRISFQQGQTKLSAKFQPYIKKLRHKLYLSQNQKCAELYKA